MRYTFTLYSINIGLFLCAAVNPRVNLKLLVMVGQKFVMVGQMPTHAHTPGFNSNLLRAAGSSQAVKQYIVYMPEFQGVGM